MSHEFKYKKFIEEGLRKDFGNLIDSAKKELVLNMMNYGGECYISTIVSSSLGIHKYTYFLEQLGVYEEYKSYLDEYFGIVYDIIGELSADLNQYFANEIEETDDFELLVKENESDGAIDIFLVYKDWESISLIDEDEWEKIVALANHFDCRFSEVTILDEDKVQVEGSEYKFYSEEEANLACQDYIEETLWAFNPSFLSNMTGIDISLFETLVNTGKCESLNEGLKDIINATCGIECFVEGAVEADGRGNFLNSYNGEEIEIYIGGETYYLYDN